MATKNGNGWHQGDWTDPNDPDYIPKPEKLFLSNQKSDGIPAAIRTASAKDDKLRRFYGEFLVPYFGQSTVDQMSLANLEYEFNLLMGLK